MIGRRREAPSPQLRASSPGKESIVAGSADDIQATGLESADTVIAPRSSRQMFNDHQARQQAVVRIRKDTLQYLVLVTFDIDLYGVYVVQTQLRETIDEPAYPNDGTAALNGQGTLNIWRGRQGSEWRVIE